MDRGPGPLWRRAPLRLFGSGTWGLLVLLAFLLLTTAAAAAPVFVEAARNAALTTTLEAVPPTAPSAEAPVVRVNGGVAPSDDKQEQLLAALAQVPGVSEPVISGGSVGAELAPYEALVKPVIVAGGRTERARIYGQDDLAATLVPAPGSPAVVDAQPGVWLPQPLAERLGVGPGDQAQVGIDSARGRTRATVRVAGVYRVAADGRLPLDPPGTHRWAQRRGLLPPDTVQVVSAYLVVTDVPGAAALADQVHDTLLWSAEVALRPPRPTLDEAERTAAAVDALGVRLLDPSVVDITSGPLRPSVASGIPDLVRHARSVADAAVSRTRTAALAGVLIGLAAVLAVGVLAVARRRVELRLDAGVGLRPVSVAGRAAVEVLPAAVLAVGLGTVIGAAVVALVGPPGRTSAASAQDALRAAVLAALAGVVLLAAVTAIAAVAASRPASGRVLRRRLPWEGLLAMAALTAALGLLGRPAAGRAPGALDLLVPLLVVAAVGAVGGRLVLQVLPRALSRRSRSPRAAPARRPALWLAARRVTVLGDERLLVVTVLTAGLGMLLYAVAGAVSVAATADDRVAVLSGAVAGAQIDTSWQLDESAPAAPTEEEIETNRPLPVVGDPRLPAGDTVVWRRTVTVPSQFGDLGLLVIDPRSFGGAASWGKGPELARARALLPGLDRAGQAAARRIAAGDGQSTQVPVLVVGPTTLRPGDAASLAGSRWVVPVVVTGVLDAFPGHDLSTTMFVAPSDAMFRYLGADDPRYRPAPDVPPGTPSFSTYVWSAAGAGEVDGLLAAHGVTPKAVTTDAQTDQLPEFVAARWGLGYLGALGGCVALLAVIGLCLYADRAAERARPAEVMLARVGMGRRGPRRARVVELSLMVVAAFALAVCGLLVVARLGPLGLDPGSGRSPAFVLRPGALALAATALAAVVALLAGASVVWARGRGPSDGTVLRDAE